MCLVTRKLVCKLSLLVNVTDTFNINKISKGLTAKFLLRKIIGSPLMMLIAGVLYRVSL